MKEKSEINPECGLRLKEILNQRKTTQLELSKHSGFTPQYISNIIHGLRPMTISAANAFSKVLGIRQEYLLCEDDYKDISSFKNNEKVKNEVSHASLELQQELNEIFKNINNLLKKKCSLNGFVCSDEDLNEFSADIRNYINMRFEKWLLPRSQNCVLKVHNVSMPEGYIKLDHTADFIESFKELLETSPAAADILYNLVEDIVSGKKQTVEVTPEERAQQWPALLKRLKEHDITIDFPQDFPLEKIPESFFYSCSGMIEGIDSYSELVATQQK